MRKVVGIDRKIKRAWLDATLDRLAQEGVDSDLRSFLDKSLKDELPGKESRAKTSGVILRIWSGVPPERTALRDRAVALLPGISGQERIWLHWGMTALAYPFFRDTAEVVGRLLALQDDFTTAQVQTRMLTSWGDRATSKEAAQKLVTMLVDWEVLRATKTKGHFLLARKMTASIPELQLWLLEALLGASAADEIEAQQLLRLPESFPFTIGVGLADLRKHEGFNIHRQGLDMDMVSLRKVKLEATSKLAKKPAKKKTASTPSPSLFGTKTAEVPSSNGKPHADPSALTTVDGASDNQADVDERRRIEESINKEVVRALSTRAGQQLEVRSAHLVPEDRPFAGSIAECAEQFQSGHYLACTALAQTTLDAMIQHIWQVKVRRQVNQKGSFEKNVSALHEKKVISDEWRKRLEKMWLERHAIHQKSPPEKSGPQPIKEAAENVIKLLHEMEREFFGHSMRAGRVVADHPEYWPVRISSRMG